MVKNGGDNGGVGVLFEGQSWDEKGGWITPDPRVCEAMFMQNQAVVISPCNTQPR